MAPTTRVSLLNNLEILYAACVDIVKAKNQDYATDTDPWANFKFAELVGVTPQRAILVRASDKLARISNLLEKDNTVIDEKIEDTIKDLINYMALLLLLLKENEGSKLS